MVNFNTIGRLAVVDHPASLNGHGPCSTSAFPSVAALGRALRRRWRLCLVAALAGLVCGVAFSLAFPIPHVSTATLLLKQSTASERALQNDAELMKSRTVAQRAIEEAQLEIFPNELRSSVIVTSLSDEILQLAVRADTAREATRRARAVADAFLRFRTEELERQARVVTDTLQERLDDINRELGAVTTQITAISADARPQGEAAVRTLGDLLSRRATLSERHQQLRQQIDGAFVGARTIVRQSRVLDPPTPEDRFALTALVRNAAAGVIGGLAVGAGWVVIQALTSERLWRREDVMEALGAPVAVVIGRYRPLRRGKRRRFPEAWRRPDRRIAPVVRQLRRTLATAGTTKPAELIVVSQDSDWPTSAALAYTALELVEHGQNVLLADLSGRSALARVFKRRGDRISLIHTAAGGATLWLTAPESRPDESSGPLSLNDVPEPIDAVLAMGVADRPDGLGHLAAWGTSAAVVVTAGGATHAELQSTARMIDAAGLELSYVVLVGADTDDQSVAVPSRTRIDRAAAR